MVKLASRRRAQVRIIKKKPKDARRVALGAARQSIKSAKLRAHLVAHKGVMRSLSSLTADQVCDLPEVHVAPVQKKLSENDARIIKLLMAKHGEDVDKMHRDIRINKWQWTATQIKNKIAQMEAGLLAPEVGTGEMKLRSDAEAKRARLAERAAKQAEIDRQNEMLLEEKRQRALERSKLQVEADLARKAEKAEDISDGSDDDSDSMSDSDGSSDPMGDSDDSMADAPTGDSFDDDTDSSSDDDAEDSD